MNRNYIIIFILSLIIPLSILTYTIRFKKCSGVYVLMQIKNKIASGSETNIASVSDICNLKTFSDSIINVFERIKDNTILPVRTTFIDTLNTLRQQENYIGTILLTAQFIEHTKGSLIGIDDKKTNKTSIELTYHYLIRGDNKMIGVTYYFERNYAGKMQLEYIKDIFLVPLHAH